MIVAAAGRRVDAPDSPEPRFPLENRSLVAARIDATLRRLEATALVASAACGADLLALEAARNLGVRRRIVLPYQSAWFLEDSVVDRPGIWAPLYNILSEEAAASDDLLVLDQPRGSDAAYAAASDAIAAEALRLAALENPADPMSAVACLIIWDGAPRGPDDLTAHLRDHMLRLGAQVLDVPTLAL